MFPAVFCCTLGMVATLILPNARAQNNAGIHTSWLWHLHQPIYWPEKRAGSEHYENAWDTIQAQGAGRSHPVVTVDQRAGKRRLYVNPNYTDSIDGLTKAESDAQSAFLAKHMK